MQSVNIYIVCVYMYVYIVCIVMYMYIYDYSWHIGTLREYVCHVGRLKGSMSLDARPVVRNAAKT